MPMFTKLVMYSEELPPLDSHDPSWSGWSCEIKWPAWGHVAILKIYISTFIRFTATKLDWVLTSGRRYNKRLSRHQSEID